MEPEMHWPRNSISGMANTHLLTFNTIPNCSSPLKSCFMCPMCCSLDSKVTRISSRYTKQNAKSPHHLVHEPLEPLGSVS